MMIKDFDFDGMKATRKQCWTYKADGNTPVKKGKNLYPLDVITDCDDFKGFFVEVVKHPYSDNEYLIWNDLGNSCVRYGNFHPSYYMDATDLIGEKLNPYKGMDGFLKKLSFLELHYDWIRLTEIMALADNGKSEEAKRYMKYHDEFKAKREEEYRKKQEETEKRAQERERRYQREIDAKLENVEGSIREKKEFQNEMIDGKSLVNRLMEKYDIKVPIRTKGWIDKSLAAVLWVDGELRYRYRRTRGTRGSQTVFQYLDMLEDAVNKN